MRQAGLGHPEGCVFEGEDHTRPQQYRGPGLAHFVGIAWRSGRSRRDARWGYRAQRVGEASRPGPPGENEFDAMFREGGRPHMTHQDMLEWLRNFRVDGVALRPLPSPLPDEEDPAGGDAAGEQGTPQAEEGVCLVCQERPTPPSVVTLRCCSASLHAPCLVELLRQGFFHCPHCRLPLDVPQITDDIEAAQRRSSTAQQREEEAGQEQEGAAPLGLSAAVPERSGDEFHEARSEPGEFHTAHAEPMAGQEDAIAQWRAIGCFPGDMAPRPPGTITPPHMLGAPATPPLPPPPPPGLGMHRRFPGFAPPTRPVQAPTNSFLFVPLLLAAADLLTPECMQAWRDRAPWFGPVVEEFRRAAVPGMLMAQAASALPPADGTHHLATFASQREVDIRSAVAAAMDGRTGYVTAPLQSLLFELFIPREMAIAVDARADDFRRTDFYTPQARTLPQPPLPPQPPPATALAVTTFPLPQF